MSTIYGNGVVMSEKVLDFLWARQSVTLNNIANVDTPQFKSQYITFENELGQHIRRGNVSSRPATEINRALRLTKANMNTTTNETTRLDGNNVDMDQEQIELVRNAYEYQYMISSINNDLTRLRNAARSF